MSTYREKLAYGDAVQRGMMESAGGVVDPERTRATIEAALAALQGQAESLKGVNFTECETQTKCPSCKHSFVFRTEPSAKDIAQAMSYTARVIDDIYRLSQFAVGNADSRPDVGVGALLEFLTDEQMVEFGRWVEAGKLRGARAPEVKKPSGETLQ